MYVQVGAPVLYITATGELEDGAQQSPSLERVPLDARGVSHIRCLPLRPTLSAGEAPSL